MDIKKMAVTSVAGLILGGVPLMATTNVALADTNSSTKRVDGTYYISNAKFFEAFEKQGIDVKAVLGDEQYKEALQEDMLAHGGTYIKGSKQGFTLYLNSAVCRVILWGGAGAASVAISELLSSVGLAPAAVGAVSSIVGGTIGAAGTKATSRGVWFQFQNNILVNWGYQ